MNDTNENCLKSIGENVSSKPIEIPNSSLTIEYDRKKDHVNFFRLCCFNESDSIKKSCEIEGNELSKYDENSFSNLYYRIKRSKYFNATFYRNNLAYFMFLLIYLLLQVLLVIIQMIYYVNNNDAILVARACGILISFNMCFVLFLISRRLITWLRGTAFGQKCLPCDEFIEFHKLVGVFVLILSLVHTLGHCVNLCEF